MNKNDEFAIWKRQLNLIISDKMGLFLEDLSINFYLEPHFEAGLTPDECFTEVITPELAMLGYAGDGLDILDDVPATFVHELSNRQAGLTGNELYGPFEATDDAIDTLFAATASAP